jgi:hypothetical protein
MFTTFLFISVIDLNIAAVSAYLGYEYDFIFLYEPSGNGKHGISIFKV